MSIGDARLWELVEQAAQAVTDVNGHWEQKPFVDEIRRLLDAEDLPVHVRAAGQDELAKRLGTSFVEKRKPKPDKSGSLFYPQSVLPLGKGKRVWMDLATDADIIAWAVLETDNTAKVLAAAGRRQAYAASRLDALRDNPGWLLGRVERELFGWIESEPPYDDDTDDGTDPS